MIAARNQQFWYTLQLWIFTLWRADAAEATWCGGGTMCWQVEICFHVSNNQHSAVLTSLSVALQTEKVDDYILTKLEELKTSQQEFDLAQLVATPWPSIMWSIQSRFLNWSIYPRKHSSFSWNISSNKRTKLLKKRTTSKSWMGGLEEIAWSMLWGSWC